MKYFVFLAFALVAVPAVATLAVRSTWRERILSLLVISIAVGDAAGINFVSLESYRGPDRGFEITLTDLLALGLLGSAVLRGQALRLPPATWLLAAFFAWSVVSALAGEELLLSAFTLFKMVRIFLLYWAVWITLKSGTSLRAIVLGMIGSGLFIAQLAVRQKYLGGIYRVPGPFDHSNTLPLFVNLMLPLVTAWALGLGERALDRRLAAAAVIGMLFAVLATFSRAGAALSVFAILATVTVAQWYLPSRTTRWAGLGLVAVLIGGGAMAADSFIDRIVNAPESSAEARHEFNIAARAMAMDHPLGVGLNRFPHVLTVNLEYRSHIEVMGTEEHAGVAHHIYWLTAAELGWGGLILFLLVMGRFTLAPIRLRGRGPVQLVGLSLTIGFMTLHASGLLEWAFRITPVTSLFAVVAALAVSVPHTAPKRITHSTRVRTVPEQPRMTLAGAQT